MIAFLRGTIVEKEPTRLVLDCNGTGYEVGVPLSTSSRLGEKGTEVGLLVVTRFTQNGVELYGFLESRERDVFRLLLSVKGIGPRAGLNFLSRFGPDDIIDTIARRRIEVIKTVPGVGPKKAERVLEELAEKTVAPAAGKPLLTDAEAALVSLGLTRREARQRLERIKVSEDVTLQDLLRLALQSGRR
ncbi:MAG: Holliday junction branch migration protein RuvA [candidate division WOR-3 bacterium]|nr:MAG: Holliday junction branch migration protein RuvA [candidate division WOR-3 bacterium]